MSRRLNPCRLCSGRTRHDDRLCADCRYPLSTMQLLNLATTPILDGSVRLLPSVTDPAAPTMAELAAGIEIGCVNEPLVGRVLCDETASLCRCSKVAGHVETGDPVHDCGACNGSWTGTFDDTRWDGGTGWRPVTMPKAVTS